MTVNDLDIRGPFRVMDASIGHAIFSWLDRSAPGDIPPDIAVLPVLRSYVVGPVLYIETEARK